MINKVKKAIRRKMFVPCVSCKKIILRTDKYCMWCGRPNQRLIASLLRLLQRIKASVSSSL